MQIKRLFHLSINSFIEQSMLFQSGCSSYLGDFHHLFQFVVARAFCKLKLKNAFLNMQHVRKRTIHL